MVQTHFLRTSGLKWRPIGSTTPDPEIPEEPDTDPPPPPPPPPPPVETYDRILENETITGVVEIPEVEEWFIGAGVIAHECHLVQRGGVTMRAGSHLHFTGGDNTLFRGNDYVHPDGTESNGLRFNLTDYPYDYGWWVENTARIDIQGTPKVSWNRTGTDPTWDLVNDEMWISPTTFGDYTPRRWYSGDPIPTITKTNPRTGQVYTSTAEVANVTRDCLITVETGAWAHWHLHLHEHPAIIKHLRIDGLGVTNKAHEGPVTGRYALHFHHAPIGAAGHVIEGVAITNCRSRGFVPHGSHGLTFTDCIYVNGAAEGFWWDANTEADRTINVTVDRMGVMGVLMPRAWSGRTPKHSGLQLPGGENMTMIGCFASGVRGSDACHGFDWPSSADNFGIAVWTFAQGNVAHNNSGQGIRLWFNNPKNHVMEDFITYRNKGDGAVNGAYRNAHTWEDGVLMDDLFNIHANAEGLEENGVRLARGVIIQRLAIFPRAAQGHAITTGSMNVPGSRQVLVQECDLVSEAGYEAALLGIRNIENPFWIRFKHCYNRLGAELTTADIKFFVGTDTSYGNVVGEFPPNMAGSKCYVEQVDGTTWLMEPNMTTHTVTITQIA